MKGSAQVELYGLRPVPGHDENTPLQGGDIQRSLQGGGLTARLDDQIGAPAISPLSHRGGDIFRGIK